MSDVFVSYSHLDRTFVRRLHTALTGREKEVWVDDHGIPPASKWADYLKEAIETADSFVFVISPDSASSVECRKELDYAASLGKRIIPLNLRASPFDQLPPVLMDRQFVPGRGLFEEDFATSLDLLVAAIETDLEWVQEHTRWGTKAIEWDEHERGRSLLVGGSELRAAETWLARGPGKEPEPTALQNAFVLASRRASDRRQRSLLGGVSAALALSLVLGGLALFQWNQAVSNQKIAQSRQEAAESEAALSSDPELSTLLALQALRVRPTAQAVTALRDALPQLQVRKTLTGAAPMQSAVFSPNGAEVATADLDGNVVIWSASTGESLRALHTPRGVSISTVVFDATGTELVMAGVDGTARIWSAATGQQRMVLGEPGGTPLNDAEFSPNGAEVVVTNLDNNVVIWSSSAGKVLEVLRVPGQDGVNTAMFSPNGSEVVTAAGNAARVWSVHTSKQLMVFKEPGGASVNSCSVSGRTVVPSNANSRTWAAFSRSVIRPRIACAGESVVIGRDILREETERGITVALGQVAQDLVVGSVFLDDVNHVAQRCDIAGLLRHNRAGFVTRRRRPAGQGLGGPLRQRPGKRVAARQRDDAKGAVVEVGDVLRLLGGRRARLRSAGIGVRRQAARTQHEEFLPIRRHTHGRGHPAGGDEAKSPAAAGLGHVEDRDRVAAGVGDEQRAAVG